MLSTFLWGLGFPVENALSEFSEVFFCWIMAILLSWSTGDFCPTGRLGNGDYSNWQWRDHAVFGSVWQRPTETIRNEVP
jgi:hypothetical protein